MPGKNIKQLTSRTNPALTDFMYLVAGDSDYNVTLQVLADLFGVEDTTGWQSEILSANGVSYINTEDRTEIGVVKLEYLAKRGSRVIHSGVITARYNNSTGGVDVDDYWENIDTDDLGLTVTGQISSGLIQLIMTVDDSDANDITFNYRTLVKKPLVVS